MILNKDIIGLISEFLQPYEIKNCLSLSTNYKKIWEPFATYLYKDYCNDEKVLGYRCAKWIVNNCTNEMLLDIEMKKLNIVHLSFDFRFNNTIDVLSNFHKLESVKFGNNFNKSVEPLIGLPKLKKIIFGLTLDIFAHMDDIIILFYTNYPLSISISINHDESIEYDFPKEVCWKSTILRCYYIFIIILPMLTMLFYINYHIPMAI